MRFTLAISLDLAVRSLPTLLLCIYMFTQTQSRSAGQTTNASADQVVLPPLVPWDGKSRELLVARDDPWITPAEASEFRFSPSYDKTIAWLRKLVDSSPQTLKMISLGKSAQDRDIWMLIASKEGAFTAEDLKRSGKPTLLWQAGIHPGEIDGKDAAMMMLRDMTVRGRKRELLDGANLLFIPIFNVDGHERAGKFNRSNQRGPEITGWRTTSRNLNLNRDYAKLDSPEMRAIVRAVDAWDPQLYFDVHVTDGADYQYDITWGATGQHGYSPAGSQWIEAILTPQLKRDLHSMGHTPGPLVFEADPLDLRKGIVQMTAEPRYSNGYGDARHLPTVLVENHALKPYDRRVLGTYVMLESVMRTLGKSAKELRTAIDADRARRPQDVPLAWKRSDENADEIDFLGIEFRVLPSAISGSLRVEWLGKPIDMRIPYIKTDKITVKVKRPKAYWVPAAWNEVIERLKIHGIRFEKIEDWREIDATMYRLNDAKFAAEPFEGRIRVSATPVAQKRREKFPPGSVRVPTDQPLGDLVVALLEPAAPDSFFEWGFFDEVLQRTEYIDGYILEPMAERMLAADPKLREEFTERLKDPTFAGSATRRLDFFYERTPFFDERWRLYPVAREE